MAQPFERKGVKDGVNGGKSDRFVLCEPRNNLLAVSNRDWIAQADAHSTLGAKE